MTTIHFERIEAETASAWLVGLGERTVWLPKSQAVLKDRRRPCFDVSAWLWRKVRDVGVRQYSADLSGQAMNAARCDGAVRVDLDGCFEQQRAAVHKLAGLTCFALFMAMRTGKTRAAALLLQNHAEHGRIDRVLWLAPVSALRDLAPKIERDLALPVRLFGIETLSACGAARLAETTDWVADGRCAMVLDESHLAKNPRAVRSRRIEALAARCPVRGLLSGTPMTRHITDLFHPLKLLDWRILGYRNMHQFEAAHLVMSDKYPGLIRDAHGQDVLAQRAAPFIFEYDPPEAATSREVVSMGLTMEQRQLYERLKGAIVARIRADDYCSHDVYLLFVALQSVLAGHVSQRVMRAALRDKEADAAVIESIPKLPALLRVLADLEGLAVIWCTRRHEAATLAAAMPGTPCITGSMPPADRHAVVQAFRRGKHRRLIAMVQVAKNGLDMYEADTAIYYGHSFDWEARRQSEARILLPDLKTRSSSFIDLRYADSLDERIAQSHAKKLNIVNEFMDLLRVDKPAALVQMEAL